MASPSIVDAYIAELPPERRAVMEDLRRTINAAAPDAAESIAYDMPTLRTRDGRFLVSYAAFKNHYSIFPASERVVSTLGDELIPYLAGKGTIRFPASRPIPLDLVRRIVETRVKETAPGRGL
jgi:uncharacterized protein YdhG (YjbR/CyaY superfamily)